MSTAFENITFNNSAYNDYAERKKHINHNQNLWRVNDDYLTFPEERFQNQDPAYASAILEQQMGPLESAEIPNGLLAYIEDMTRKFKVIAYNGTEPYDVARRIMHFLDYSEPYYMLVNSPINLEPGANLNNTYRRKSGGCLIPPDTIEVFRVQRGFDFPEFRKAESLLNHPMTKTVLEGGFVRHKTRGDAVTRRDLLDHLSECVWGNSFFLNSWIEEWVDAFYRYTDTDADLGENVDAIIQKNTPYWQVAGVATLMWFKSPYSLKFLVDYHPIYNAVLSWDTEKGHPVEVPGSEGIALISGWDIYTMNELIVEEGQPAGSCAICKELLHCTKSVNSWAVVDPICSCGEPIKIEADSEYDIKWGSGSHRSPKCDPYQESHPGYPKIDFLCMHCLFAKVNKTPLDMKCGRKQCPNTKCAHHMGNLAYIRGLTENRRMLLADNRR